MAAGRAFFGPPRDTFVPGGAHITVYLIPVFRQQLVIFEVAAREARGRWLPWDVVDFGANPYESASTLADDWCGVSLRDLALVDVMSFPFENNGWELAIVFRAELEDQPIGDSDRKPALLAPGHLDAIGPFDPVDLERWLGAKGATAANPAKPANLLF